MRIATLALTALLTLSMAASTSLAQDNGATEKPPADLVVHEWGTFTSIVGEDGSAQQWRPLQGPSDLPSFVYDIENPNPGLARTRPQFGKGAIIGSVRMETPVLYFYADKEMEVSAKVSFPQGLITEWYPALKTIDYQNNNRSNTNQQQIQAQNQTIDWGTFTLTPGPDPVFPQENQPSHYYPARETDATPLRVSTPEGDQVEKFLFYRGVGSFEAPFKATWDENSLEFMPMGGSRHNIIIFEKQGDKIAFEHHTVVKCRSYAERPSKPKTQQELEQALMEMLTKSGLYPKEAQSMIATWRDHWFEDGLRIFYLMDRKETDKVLPLTITPTPKELVRTMVGRLDLVTPEQRQDVAQLITKAAKQRGRKRRATVAHLRQKYGRFLPVIYKMVQPDLKVSLSTRLKKQLITP